MAELVIDMIDDGIKACDTGSTGIVADFSDRDDMSDSAFGEL